MVSSLTGFARFSPSIVSSSLPFLYCSSSLEEYVNVTFSLYLIEDGLAMQISSACRVCERCPHLRFLRLNQTTLRFLQISSVCFENFMNFFYSNNNRNAFIVKNFVIA